MKLNTQGWKKIKSEKDHTVMRNKDGHEMKIAHHALSPKFRGQLAALPMAEGGDIDPRDQAPMNMAEGGKVQHYFDGAGPVSSVQDSPDQIAQDAQAQAPQAAPAAPPQEAPQAAAPQDPYAEMPQQPVPNLPTMPTGAQQVAELQDADRKNYIQGHINDRDAFANDLVNGHITPKTYGELADKSSLGRIGTMFGLMLGGIGSGITGQPNALIGMMDKEIDRDLTAQQQSKSNAQNLYNLTSARIGAEANAGLTNVTSAEKTFALAKMQYQQLALHKMMDITSKLPPGPQRQQAEQAISMMAGQINQGDYNMLDKLHAYELVNGAGAQNNQSAALDPAEAQFQARNAALNKSGDPHNIAIAKYEADRHIPGIPGSATDAVDPHSKALLLSQNILDQKGKDLLNYIDQHKGLNLNRWNPQDRAIATQKVEELKNFYNNSIQGGALTEGRLDWYDKQLAKNPLDILPQLLGSTAKFKEVINSNAGRRDAGLKALGYKGYPAQSALTPNQGPQSSAPNAGPQEGSTGTFKGRPVTFVGGKWQYR